ncbi:peptidoglycan DD-metalloendopeptidase family protein [Dyadobacter psychrotolerans]|uniref:Peptidase M23 n=1 Tax=Dyadobacter psychrotolerans TaxID=2541721 RepID=A0A4R5DAX1_9BACT|nr:peptidoglycan DD-metalloendopeptidase family protein [Dyadobacter psychrotolerans]TDE10007.1 peptidase M23 [Dyadobacter psychrotolerans]
MKSLSDILQQHHKFAEVIRNPLPFKKLDFSRSNPDLLQRDLSKTSVFTDYVFEEMLDHSTYTGIGGYGEKRVIYRQLAHFSKQEENPRCIHLGIDIWAPAGENIFTPLDGKVHSFAFNDHVGDYGPTIILEHELEGVKFHTLYGHLSLDSLTYLYTGKKFLAGDRIAAIGNHPENGDWPPHLHFQVISDIKNYKGDYPGVCSLKEKEYFLFVCPDPNLILRI